jgi:hypothetical protein
MLCVLMIHIVMDIFEIMLSMFDYLLYVIIIMLIYGIKMVRKMPIFLILSSPKSCRVHMHGKDGAHIHGPTRRISSPAAAGGFL